MFNRVVDDEHHYFDIGGALSFLLRNKFRIVLSTLAFALAAAFISLQLTPYYSATSQVMLTARVDNITGYDSVIGQRPLTNIMVQSEIAVLTSENLLSDVLESVPLEHAPFVKEEGPNAFAKLKAMIFGEQPLEPPSLKDRITQLRDTISVNQIGESFVIKITALTGDPDQSAAVANGVAELYLSRQIDEKIGITRRAEAFQRQRVVEYSENLRKAEAAVDAHRLKVAVIDERSGEQISDDYESLKARLESSRLGLTELERKIDETEHALTVEDDGRLIAALERLRGVRTASLLRDFDSSRAALTEALQRGEPDLTALLSRISEVESTIRTVIEGALETDRTTAKLMRGRIDLLSEKLVQIEERAQIRSQSLVDLRRLEQEAEATRTIYQNFLDQLKTTKDQFDALGADAQIISDALPDTKPSKPNKAGFILIGGFFGAIFGVVWALASETFRNTYRRLGELEAATGLRELGFFVRVKPRLLRRAMDGEELAQNNPLHEGAQNMIALLASRARLDGQTILVTSAFPSEGKTTTSLLLAMALRRLGKTVLVVECDLHRPVHSKIFRAKPEFDLLDVVNDTCGPATAVHHDKRSGISILMSRRHSRSVEVLSSAAFKEALRSLANEYDTIVLDGPPAIATADAIVLGSIADETILCYRWDATPRDDFADTVEKLSRTSADIAGAVITLVNPKEEVRYHRVGRGKRKRDFALYGKYAGLK